VGEVAEKLQGKRQHLEDLVAAGVDLTFPQTELAPMQQQIKDIKVVMVFRCQQIQMLTALLVVVVARAKRDRMELIQILVVLVATALLVR
jgi:hypothetical protein